jgi:hypothetical protein
VNSNVYGTVTYQAELDHATKARAEGNEGMARVCARRAAGIIVGEYLGHRGISNLSNSAYDRLVTFNHLPDISPELKEIAGHFLLRVDHDHQLPEDVDLLFDVQILAKELLKDRIH